MPLSPRARTASSEKRPSRSFAAACGAITFDAISLVRARAVSLFIAPLPSGKQYATRWVCAPFAFRGAWVFPSLFPARAERTEDLPVVLPETWRPAANAPGGPVTEKRRSRVEHVAAEIVVVHSRREPARDEVRVLHDVLRRVEHADGEPPSLPLQEEVGGTHPARDEDERIASCTEDLPRLHVGSDVGETDTAAVPTHLEEDGFGEGLVHAEVVQPGEQRRVLLGSARR